MKLAAGVLALAPVKPVNKQAVTNSLEVSGRKHIDRLITKAEYETLHGNFSVAETLLKEAVEDLEKTLHATETDLAVAKHNLISVLETQGKVKEAGLLRKEICALLTPPGEP
ncbi:MAG: hypothetical protein C0507_22650 [Cyanobacteria bacterium PR.3.49]|nr:hypothetical protein [Cyanobacteria bacterium PR.3.49]